MTDSPFLRRWHLYHGDNFEWTAIPLDDCMRLIGKVQTSRKSVPHEEYEAFKTEHDLREAKP